MRAVIQRVHEASVHADGSLIASIGKGSVALIGIHRDDTQKDMDYVTEKILHARIFDDESGTMNRSLCDVSGELLLVSQFTLYGDIRKGRRPSYSDAMPPSAAREYYETFVRKCAMSWDKTRSGIFGADMILHIANAGPVTILIDSYRFF